MRLSFVSPLCVATGLLPQADWFPVPVPGAWEDQAGREVCRL